MEHYSYWKFYIHFHHREILFHVPLQLQMSKYSYKKKNQEKHAIQEIQLYGATRSKKTQYFRKYRKPAKRPVNSIRQDRKTSWFCCV